MKRYLALGFIVLGLSSCVPAASSEPRVWASPTQPPSTLSYAFNTCKYESESRVPPAAPVYYPNSGATLADSIAAGSAQMSVNMSRSNAVATYFLSCMNAREWFFIPESQVRK